ncbi:MAG: hypothetical protein KAG61_01395 [Bacteriovoracaceae bacterium]|nr:hypothetical protein [Bacteriovoracaceae bacterium]
MGKLTSLLFFTILLTSFLSCSKEYSGYKSTGTKSAVISPVHSSIDSAEAIDWTVGTMGKYTVSKGIRLKIHFPALEMESVRDLNKKMKVDSWLVRIHKRSNYGSKILGYFFVPMIAPGSDVYSTSFRVRQIEYGVVNIYYAAAGHTPRFENLKCPPFNHQFRIEDKDIVIQKSNKLTKMMVGPSEYSYIRRKIESFGYRPTTINAGMSLIGTYFADVALFDSKNKVKRSSYLQLPESVRVKLERTSPVPGCTDFEVTPRRPGKEKSYKDFRFGK